MIEAGVATKFGLPEGLTGVNGDSWLSNSVPSVFSCRAARLPSVGDLDPLEGVIGLPGRWEPGWVGSPAHGAGFDVRKLMLQRNHLEPAGEG